MVELIIARNGGGGVSKIDISSAIITLASGTLTYDETLKTQGVASVVVDGITLVENTDYMVINNTAINAGEYTLLVVGIGDYSGIAVHDWHVERASVEGGSITISPSSMSLLGVGASDTATITAIGDGEVKAISSDTSVATATINGNTLTVTSVGVGSATITVLLAIGVNYQGGSDTLEVSVVIPSATLADNSPEVIQAVAKAGNASALWSVGDMTAPISFQNVTVGRLSMNGLSACAFIIGFDHNSSKEGTGIHFQFGKTKSGTDIAFCDSSYGNDVSDATFHMNSSYNNSGGWESSYMRSTICQAFLTALPTAWQNVIILTDKYTDNTDGDSSSSVTCTATSDKIWLLSTYEVFGTINDSRDEQQVTSSEATYCVQYDYYKNGNSKIKYRHNATTTACAWWLRSRRYSDRMRFCHVHYRDARLAIDRANISYGFAPAFRVA